MQAPKPLSAAGGGALVDAGGKGSFVMRRDAVRPQRRDTPPPSADPSTNAALPPSEAPLPAEAVRRLARLWRRHRQQSDLVQRLEGTLCAMNDPCFPGSRAQLEDSVRAQQLWGALDRMQVDVRAGKLQQVNQSKFTLSADYIQASPFRGVLQLLHDRLLPTCHRLYQDGAKTLSGVWKMVLLTDSLRTPADRQQCLDAINQCLMRSSIAHQTAISLAGTVVELLARAAPPGATGPVADTRDAATQTTAGQPARPHLCLGCQHAAMEQAGGVAGGASCSLCQGSLLLGCGACEGTQDPQAEATQFLRLKESGKDEGAVDYVAAYEESRRVAEARFNGQLRSSLARKVRRPQQKKQVSFVLDVEDDPQPGEASVFHNPATARRLSTEGIHPRALLTDPSLDLDPALSPSEDPAGAAEDEAGTEDSEGDGGRAAGREAAPDDTDNTAGNGDSERSVLQLPEPAVLDQLEAAASTSKPAKPTRPARRAAAQLARRRLAEKREAAFRPRSRPAALPTQLMPPAVPAEAR
eukprot:EG_transcript_9067